MPECGSFSSHSGSLGISGRSSTGGATRKLSAGGLHMRRVEDHGAVQRCHASLHAPDTATPMMAGR